MGLAEAPERRTSSRLEARRTESTAPRADPGERVESELKRLCEGLMRQLESDRAQVARVLSEEVASVITMARYLIEDAARRLARGEIEETSEELQNASARIREATHELVSLCSELRPRVLDDLGLLPALSWHFREFSRQNRTIFVSPRITVAESDVPPELKLTVFRVVQTALLNVARHSKASAVRVYLSLFEDELSLNVEDNGVGFDLERWRNRRGGHDGCGLAMIGRWVEVSGGRCSLEATPRHGASVQALWRLHGLAPVADHAKDAEADAHPTQV